MPEFISVDEFIAETLEDYSSPTTSSFFTKMSSCRNAAHNIEEVWNYTLMCCFFFSKRVMLNTYQLSLTSECDDQNACDSIPFNIRTGSYLFLFFNIFLCFILQLNDSLGFHILLFEPLASSIDRADTDALCLVESIELCASYFQKYKHRVCVFNAAWMKVLVIILFKSPECFETM